MLNENPELEFSYIYVSHGMDEGGHFIYSITVHYDRVIHREERNGKITENIYRIPGDFPFAIKRKEGYQETPYFTDSSTSFGIKRQTEMNHLTAFHTDHQGKQIFLTYEKKLSYRSEGQRKAGKNVA